MSMMNRKHLIAGLSAFFLTLTSSAQDDMDKSKLKALKNSQNLTWEANKELSENNFVGAEADYRRAISKSEENVAAPYNLGNAYYDQDSYSEAFGRFKQAGELASDKSDKHRAFHNMGNVFMKSKEYEKAVEAYKEALRNNPKDEETRYNLALAKEMLEKEKENQKQEDKEENEEEKDQKQDQQNEGDNQEDNKGQQEQDEKEDPGKQGDQDKEENKEGEGDDKEEKSKQPPQAEQEQEQKPRPNQLSPQQIQNLLEAMQNEEKKVQEKMDAKKVKGVKLKNVKDW